MSQAHWRSQVYLESIAHFFPTETVIETIPDRGETEHLVEKNLY